MLTTRCQKNLRHVDTVKVKGSDNAMSNYICISKYKYKRMYEYKYKRIYEYIYIYIFFLEQEEN